MLTTCDYIFKYRQFHPNSPLLYTPPLCLHLLGSWSYFYAGSPTPFYSPILAIKSHKNGSSWSFSNTSDFDVALGFMSPQKRVCRVASCQPLYGVYCSILYYLVKKLCSKDYMQVRTYMIVVIFNWEPALLTVTLQGL